MTTDYLFLKSKLHEALPERLIEGHPTYSSARKAFDEVADRYARATAACAKSNKIAAELERSIERLRSEHAELKARLPTLAMRAIEEKDTKFTAAVDARAELQRILWEIEARTDALAGVRHAHISKNLHGAAESAAISHTAAQERFDSVRSNVRDNVASALAAAFCDDKIGFEVEDLTDWAGHEEALAFARTMV
jgi:chromosome segregation ATPase